jgi:ribosomal protein L11 methyltransferase
MRLVRLELDPDHAEQAIERVLDAWPDGARVVREGDLVSATVVGEDPPVGALRSAAGPHLTALHASEIDAAAARRLSAWSRSIAGRVVLRAPDAPPAPAGQLDIVVEREGGVFGTGAHPTTEALIELLLGLEPSGSLVDVGCGTGVLAVVAARLGFAPVDGYDIDAAAAACARRVAGRNGAACTFEQRDALSSGAPAADVVVANVPLHVHLALADGLPARVALVSGLHADEAPRALAAYAAAGLRPVAGGVTPTGWYAGALRR